MAMGSLYSVGFVSLLRVTTLQNKPGLVDTQNIMLQEVMVLGH